MAELSEADKYLIDQIRRKNADAWTQLVQRYQGRLLAFARGKLRQPSDAEDLVQDTFISFLKSIDAYREEAGLETYLFTILRRKIVDWFRGQDSAVCLLEDRVTGDSQHDDAPPAIQQVPSRDETASWYARRDEVRDICRTALTASLRDLVAGYRKTKNFRDLKIVEMIFYCQLRNKDVASMLDMDEKQIALIKHRVLKTLRDSVTEHATSELTVADLEQLETERADALLIDIWRAERLSCPKRNTLGAYLLDTLDTPWQDYVKFHLDHLGCTYCLASLDDLRNETASANVSDSFRNRILESTVGFLRSVS